VGERDQGAGETETGKIGERQKSETWREGDRWERYWRPEAETVKQMGKTGVRDQERKRQGDSWER
jgi:hypothetical protein